MILLFELFTTRFDHHLNLKNWGFSRLHPGTTTGPVVFDCYDYDDKLEQEAARVNWRAALTPTQEVRKAGVNEKN
jgi:hypothetical protein